MKHVYAKVLIACGLFFFVSPLDASCCSSASTGGIGRLLAHERALVELSSGMRYLYGAGNNLSQFSLGHSPRLPHMVMDSEIQIMARLFSFFEPFIRLPTRIQKSKIRVGGGLADMSIGARMPLFKENLFYFWPGLSLFTSLRLPTGTYFEAGQGLTNESITGTGLWFYTLGFLLEKEFLGISYGLGYSFSADKDYFTGEASWPSASHSPFFTINLPLGHNFLSLATSFVFHGADISRYQKIENSDRRKLSLSLAYGMNLHSHVKATLHVGSDLPLPSMTKNFSNEFFLRMSFRFGVY